MKGPLAFIESAVDMGGVQTSTLYLADRLRRMHYAIIVISPGEGTLNEHCRARGIPTVSLPEPRLIPTSMAIGRKYVPNPIAWVTNLLAMLPFAWRLSRQLRKHSARVVCTKGMFAHFYGGLAARWAGLPCVWHVQDLVSDRAGRIYPLALGLAGKVLAHWIIADGAVIAEQLSRYYARERIRVIPNGVDTDVFAPNGRGRAVRQEWAVAEDELLIGNVARFTRWKGQHILVEAFASVAAQNPKAKLVLVGAPVFDTADYERELRRLVAELGLQARVIFAGYRMDLPEVLAALDLYVHPSTEKDTSPLSVVSAMSAGKPIISSDLPGIRELFSESAEAILLSPADVPALAVAIQNALTAPARREALGCAARHRAEQALSLDRFASQCDAVFAGALSTD